MNTQIDMLAVRERLEKSRADSGKSMRQVSLDAGQGAGYYHSIVKSNNPSVENISKVADALNVSLPYILFGLNMTPETQRIIELLEKNPEKRAGLLSLLSGQ